MKIKAIRTILLAVLTLSSTLTTYGQTSTTTKKGTDTEMSVARAIDLFRNVLIDTKNLYVDTLNISKMTTDGINAMLSELDPYTIYMPETEGQDFKFLTTGEYAGIGAYIQPLDSAVYVDNALPGTPAKEAGLRMGDKFVKIDGKSVIPGTAKMVSGLLKGPAGTTVTVTFRRNGEDHDRTITITRQNVTVNQVVHKGLYKDSIGYIRLASFTDKSANDVWNAYQDLAKTHKMKSLILDLRSNGGGILDEAISILSMFVPAKTMILYTKDKHNKISQRYFTSDHQVDTKIPIVVLINGGTASASEIVSGSIQDLDRGVLVGSKSFGKGLVQTTRPEPNNGVLKVTIARYYIPSGRCIQQLDYSHRNPDGSVAAVPDSLTHIFKTKNGRSVRDGGGIRPDVTVKEESISPMIYNMIRSGYLFGYSNKLALEKGKVPSMDQIQVTDKDIEGLINYLEQKKFTYGDLTLKAMGQLKELAKFEGYQAVSDSAFTALSKVLKPNLRRDLLPQKEEIKRLLRGLIAAHYYGMNGQYAIGLENDPTFAKAVEILQNKKLYHKLLTDKNNTQLSQIKKTPTK